MNHREIAEILSSCRVQRIPCEHDEEDSCERCCDDSDAWEIDLSRDPLDLVRLGNGASRVTYADDRYVYKRIRESGDDIYNIAEWEVYQIVPDKLRAMLARPIYISENGNVLVMERLPQNSVTSQECDTMYDKLKTLFEAIGLDNVVSDCHEYNFGKRKDGSIAWFDYSFFVIDNRLGSAEQIQDFLSSKVSV